MALAYRGATAIQIKPEEYYAKTLRASTLDPMFTICNDQIRLFPTPIAGNTCEIMFIAEPAALTSETSILTTKAEFDDLIIITSVYFLSLMTGARSETVKEAVSEQIKAKSIYFNSNVNEVKK
ncbi:MAG: hypothetical protein EOM87_10300 [Clostridia bacterium]|nr:hypothetical protein [Clostridia bacterium]